MKYDLEQKHSSSRTFDLIHTPPWTLRFATLLFVTLSVFLVLLFIIPWQQTSMGSGRVVAYSPTERQQSIDAPVEGRLGKWFVQEGSVVKEGDPIVEISDNDPEILNRLKTEKQAIIARLEAAEISVKTALINMDRQKTLAHEGLSSRRSYELAQLEHAKFLTDVANAQAELSRIEVRLARQTTQSVKSPRNGTILRRTSGEGSVLVKAGQSLATIVPDTESRAVELWIDGNDIALVNEGQPVRLQFEGWPALQFSGWPSVAVGTFGGKIAIVDAADSGDGRFRVLIVPDGLEPWPHAHYLRQGILAHGWIILNQVKLGYELWRRFNGFPPSLKTQPKYSEQNPQKTK
jgi:multidrug efflux pump subunit AcrA (membrane-fusion protein)